MNKNISYFKNKGNIATISSNTFNPFAIKINNNDNNDYIICFKNFFKTGNKFFLTSSGK